MKHSGTADLPLHNGSVPPWLAERMTRLGTAICESVIHHYGVSQLLSRLADPFWFQSLGCVMGMDWHSSGITTSVLGALKKGLNPRERELGVFVCGGRGRHSRQTPAELRAYAERKSLNAESLVRSSRLVARVDNNAVADGFQLYLHGFFISKTGEWAVVQQGMNDHSAMARRYHWHSETVRDFTSQPHSGIVGEHQGAIVNLVDEAAKPAQEALLQIAREAPDPTLQEVRKLAMPRHHEVRAADVDLKRLGAVLAAANEREFHDFASLLLLEKLGPRTLQTLALVAEVVHGTPVRFSDPARFSFALGGKDGHPFPVPLKVYDETLSLLRSSLDRAKLETGDKADGIKRLDAFVRTIERTAAPEANFEAAISREKKMSRAIGGRTVLDDRRAGYTVKPRGKKSISQLSLF